MGEILLVCSLITLVLLVLFIHKKKEQERQYMACKKNSVEDSCQKRFSHYSRDDSSINKISPFRNVDESAAKYDHNIRQRHNSWISPRRNNLNYDRFYYYNRRNDGDYSYINNPYSKQCNCDSSNCRCFQHHPRGYCTPSNYERDIIQKVERKDSYFNIEIKSENFGKQIENDNYSITKAIINPNFANNNTTNFMQNNQTYNHINFMNGKFNVANPPPNGSFTNNSLKNQNIQNNYNTNCNNNNPGYKIIKLEDFLEKEKRDCSPIYRKKNEITLDEVHHSLIKFIKNEDRIDYEKKSPDNKIAEKSNSISDITRSKNNENDTNFTQFHKESNLIKCDEGFLNELIPKKIDFSLFNDTDNKHKNNPPEEIKFSTPLTKNEKGLFKSFGVNNEESFKSLKST